ncbi:hypothetical protein AIOL_002020 [Candidatus Rhodobacter oscarellae]|uniref:Uncharacterized protein n=1 Tax=Candidatus Rhodobacter oscarellae TaxID=1675527 RepID=A0A0J9E2Y0_9RHOB|nr:hypothetical protein AIOL_002020 [Candidatus Rhodobacter lobularis]
MDMVVLVAAIVSIGVVVLYKTHSAVDDYSTELETCMWRHTNILNGKFNNGSLNYQERLQKMQRRCGDI